MKRVNIYLIISALLLIILGVVCMIHPGESILTASWLIGLLVLISGCSSLIFGLRAQRFLPNAGSTTLLAIFQIIVGLIFLSNGMLAEATIIVVFAIWVMFEGISLAVLSFDYKRSGYKYWWSMLLLGLCSMVLGFLSMRNPDTTSIFLGILVGLGIFANGIVRLVAFTALKRLGEDIRELRESATAINIDDNQQE